MSDKNIEQLVDEMSLQEQVRLLSGQDFWSVPGNERLGIGTLRVTDGPNGARGGGSLIGGMKSASFPVGIALGATWNPALVGEIGAALAEEVKSKGAHVSLAPTVNIHRSVTNGRNFECYSEDPVLAAELAVAYIKGLQDNGISATIKHFAGNESEIERTTINSVVDERALREIYLIPFEAAVKQAGTWGVMSSYNKLNGTYAAENEWLLTKVLREDWGFDGVVMSDWFGSRTTAPTVNAGLDLEMPGPTRDRGDKLIAAVEAGEVSAETIRARALNVLRLMQRTGAIDDFRPFEEQAIDQPGHRALIRRAGAEAAVLLKNKNVLPLSGDLKKIAVIGPNAKVAQIMGGGSAQLNPHYAISPYEGVVSKVGEAALAYAPGCDNHRFEPLLKGSFKAEFFANEKLEGAPVYTGVQEDAQAFMVPPLADGKVDPAHFSVRMTGNFTPKQSGTHRVGVHAAGLVKVYVDGELVTDAWSDWKAGRTFFEEGSDPVVGEVDLEAGKAHEVVIELASKPAENLNFTAFYVGIGRPLGDADIEAAAQAAADCEVALLFVGRSGEWDTEGSDLEHINLPGRQDELVAAVAAVNTKTIVVLQTGGPVEMPWLKQVAGLIEAWYPGQEAGNAIADVLFGDAEPGGRLPQSFPKKWADNPTHSQDPEIYPGLDGKVRYEEGLFIGYRHYDKAGIEPLFPFGFGLGYTQMEFAAFDVDMEDVDGGGNAVISFSLRNIGDRRGSEVVQIYVRDEHGSVERPIRELKAFKKVTLDANDGQSFTLELSPRDFAFFDVAGQCWRVEPGSFEIYAGFSAGDIRAAAQVTIGQELVLPV